MVNKFDLVTQVLSLCDQTQKIKWFKTLSNIGSHGLDIKKNLTRVYTL